MSGGASGWVRVLYAPRHDIVKHCTALCAAAPVSHPEAGEAVALYLVPEAGSQDVLTVVRRSLPVEWICDSVDSVRELRSSWLTRPSLCVAISVVPGVR